MSGAANFELTAEDYVGAQRGHGKRLSAWLALLFFVCAILFALVDRRIGVSPWSDWNLWLVVTIGLMFLAWEFIARDAIIRRQFRQSLPMRSPLRTRWDEKSLWIDTDNSQARYDWNRFYRWSVSRTTLMLYRDKGFFIPIPRRAFEAEQFDDMVAALKAAGVKEIKL